MTTATENKIHRFQAAGLGIAPFTVVGIESTADRAAMNREREANGQVFTTNNCGGTCDYCGQAIWNVFKIRSADGHEFKVGCDCVRKTGDAGLIRIVDEGVKKIERKARQQRAAEAAAAGKAYFASKREELKAYPHPTAWRAEQGETAAQYFDFIAANSGLSGLAGLGRKIDAFIRTAAKL